MQSTFFDILGKTFPEKRKKKKKKEKEKQIFIELLKDKRGTQPSYMRLTCMVGMMQCSSSILIFNKENLDFLFLFCWFLFCCWRVGEVGTFLLL